MDISRGLPQDYEEERAALEAQAKAYEFYAGLIARATGSGAKLPVWDPTTAERYRELARRARARLAELDRLITARQQEKAATVEAVVSGSGAEAAVAAAVAATPVASVAGQEAEKAGQHLSGATPLASVPLASIPFRPAAGWLHTPQVAVQSSHGNSTFRYRPGLHEFSGSVGVMATIALLFVLIVYGIMIYESLFVLPHLAP